MSMELALALVGMTTLAVVILLVPLLVRQRRAEPRREYDLVVYRDQLAEVERDIDRGVLTVEQAEAARLEISRRMLALAPENPQGGRSSAAAIGVATVTVALVPVAALALYWYLGSPGVPDQPFADRGQASPNAVASGTKPGTKAGTKAPHIDMAQAVARLSAHLKESPDDLNGWLLLGRSQLSRGHYHDAVAAYRRAADLSGQRADVVGDYGEALMLAADGTVTPAAKTAFETAMKDPESAPRSHYYLGLAKLQAGNAKGALQDWVDLEAKAPKDAAWLPILRKHIDEAAKSAGVDPTTLKTSAGVRRAAVPAAPAVPAMAAPTAPAVASAAPAPAPDKPAPASAAPAMPNPNPNPNSPRATGSSEDDQPTSEQLGAAAQAAAAATPEARQTMIKGMVAKLAARLQQQPNDPDGWIRLGRSYMVLNQPAQARGAYARAERLKPDDITVKIAYADAIVAAVGDTATTPPDEVVRLMREVMAKEPDNEEALWYVGIAEAAAGHAQTAHDLWTRLLGELPDKSPERAAVEQRLAALKLGGGK